MSMRPFRALVRKDLQVTIGNRRAVMMSFIVPIALGSFMALAMGGAGDNGTQGEIKIRVIDLDQSDLSRKIVTAIEEDKNLEVVPGDEAEAREAVRRGNTAVAAIIPKGFGASASKAMFGAADKPELMLLRDPSHNAEAGMVRGILMQHIMESVSKDAFSGAGGKDAMREAMAQVEKSTSMTPGDRATLKQMFDGILRWQERSESSNDSTKGSGGAMARGGLTTPFELKEEVIAAGKGTGISRTAMYAHSFAGMAVQFILFGSIEAGVGLLAERKLGLWKRVRSAPLPRRTLLAAKAVSGALWSLLTAVVVFGFAAIFFGIRVEGSLIGFLLIVAAFSLMASAMGLLIASLGNSPEAARGTSILVVLMMVMLGGAWMPSFLFPSWIQKISLAIPTRWAVDGMDGNLWRGFTLVESLGPVAVLLGFAALCGGLAWAFFRWEAD